jgi:hypothetical protein
VQLHNGALLEAAGATGAVASFKCPVGTWELPADECS